MWQPHSTNCKENNVIYKQGTGEQQRLWAYSHYPIFLFTKESCGSNSFTRFYYHQERNSSVPSVLVFSPCQAPCLLQKLAPCPETKARFSASSPSSSTPQQLHKIQVQTIALTAQNQPVTESDTNSYVSHKNSSLHSKEKATIKTKWKGKAIKQNLPLKMTRYHKFHSYAGNVISLTGALTANRL